MNQVILLLYLNCECIQLKNCLGDGVGLHFTCTATKWNWWLWCLYLSVHSNNRIWLDWLISGMGCCLWCWAEARFLMIRTDMAMAPLYALWWISHANCMECWEQYFLTTFLCLAKCFAGCGWMLDVLLLCALCWYSFSWCSCWSAPPSWPASYTPLSHHDHLACWFCFGKILVAVLAVLE